MLTIAKRFLLTLLLIGLSACGGGGGELGGNPGGGGGTTTVRIGSGTGGTFVEGALALGLNMLSAGGMTSVTANLVDNAGNPFTTATSITFTSICAGSGLAQLDSPVTTNNGLAVSTYRALGCTGNDMITATAVVNGVTLTATGSVEILAAVLGSLEFVSAIPSNVALQGTGGGGRSETSTVIFRVKDTNGNPVAGQQVQFTLNTTVGGLNLTPAIATSLSNGTVQTAVAAGTVATTVRVTATIISTSISSQSDELVVSSGTPDQNSFSISAVTLNPETLTRDGIIDPINILVADHFNNPVPDGTAISFTTEGAQIQSSCLTVDGRCSVNWTSSNPRPPGDGRVTILATAIGEESFIDINGNGRLDATGEDFTDLEEAFRDDDEDGVRDPLEEFVDFNANGIFEAIGDGRYNGLLCTPAARAVGSVCNAPTTLNVRESVVLVMSETNPRISISASPIRLSICQPNTSFTNTPVAITINVVGAINGQIMPAGTTISVSTSNGMITSAPSFTVPNSSANVTTLPVANTTGLSTFNFIIRSDATQTVNPIPAPPAPPPATPFTCSNTDTNGVFTIRIRVPSGSETVSQVTVLD